MTREEAIKQLDTMWKMLTSAYDDIADSHVAAYTMAVDALKAQGTCEDAVSRQTLQKELALYPIDDITSEDEAGYNRAINDVQKMVLHLPPVQTDVPNTNVGNNDLINRSDAIDAVDKLSDEPIGYLEAAIDALVDLPSAQPEQRYTEEELRVFQHGISLSLLSKESAQHWRYDEDRATEIKFLERLYDKVSADMKGGQG